MSSGIGEGPGKLTKWMEKFKAKSGTGFGTLTANEPLEGLSPQFPRAVKARLTKAPEEALSYIGGEVE